MVFKLHTVPNSITRLWDLRSEAAHGLLKLHSQPCVSYDHAGVCMACSSVEDGIKLYDTRNMDRGPFLSFGFQKPITAGATSLKFSSDGNYLLICGAEDSSVHLVDAYRGNVRTWFVEGASRFQEASFSPDSNFVVGGKACSKIYRNP